MKKVRLSIMKQMSLTETLLRQCGVWMVGSKLVLEMDGMMNLVSSQGNNLALDRMTTR